MIAVLCAAKKKAGLPKVWLGGESAGAGAGAVAAAAWRENEVEGGSTRAHSRKTGRVRFRTGSPGHASSRVVLPAFGVQFGVRAALRV